jgi:protein ImuB
VVTGEPTRFLLGDVLADGWQPVAAWAGPWPLDESWWSAEGGRSSRFQVVGADGRAWLLACGPDGWRVEAGYD